ncbi:hypothetical protein HFQ13_10625 [Acidithiobacillus sp. VAN18-1]|uniref:DotM C-terminal cytoplasmic domain-containing protein n=1 Tax=Igneacidithiobacillus copahuensis TaxID=2724909 RepID=A0AAE3CKM1_9PROT|nr:hypothetical protein [Igneacidithiobacillus copahuensis]MBU2788645.1 hypothetical protein [Igneacidithiobacillus copahuensis]MBU2796671.1 hypothetical protein [Acidithiobacillus sp. VAN18-2]
MAASANPQQQSLSSDDFFSGILIALGIIALIWFFGRDAVMLLWKGFKIAELWALIHLSSNPDIVQNGHLLLRDVEGEPFTKITWKQANFINGWIDACYNIRIGRFQFSPWMLFLNFLPMVVASLVWSKGKNLRQTFRKPWDLAVYMAREYPWMLPVIRQRSSILARKFVSSKGYFDSLMNRQQQSDWPIHPLNILIDNKIIDRNGNILPDQMDTWVQKQLGPKAGQTGFSRPESAALFQAFVSKEPARLLKAYAARPSALKKMSGLNESARKKYQEYRKRHAYEITILLAALADARKNGILPPSWFIFLKYINRPFWYALHGLKLPRPHAEGLPAIIQYEMERHDGRPVEQPQSQWVIKGLQLSIDETDWKKSKAWRSYVNQG